MTKSKRKGGKKLTAKELQIEILKFLLAHPKKPLSARQLIQLLKISNNKDSVSYALQQLEEAGSVTEKSEGKYTVALDKLTKDIQLPKDNSKPKKKERRAIREVKRKIAEGTVDMTRSGSAYIETDSLEEDVYISPKNLQGALHGDTVRIIVFPERPGRYGRKKEGEVIKVLKRAREHFLGTLRINRKYAIFYPDNPQTPIDIYIPSEAFGDARDGDKVVVQVTDWQEGKGRIPKGKVTQVMGNVGSNDFEMNKILLFNGFPLSHEEATLKEAENIPETISDQEKERRRDFRDILTFTIDPEDARDFDDALSVRKLEDGKLEVGIHIADVTHYLKPGSDMDKEAFERSTSVYLVDRVAPMLPEKLSNNLCSLVPEQDRLAFSAVFTFDENYGITNRWFGKTVIYSDKRFTYEEAQTIIEGKPEENLREHPMYKDLSWAVNTLTKVARKLRKDKFKNGAINFDSEEIRFKLAEDGTPIDAYVKERKEAHLLIEDFMLLANREVAFFIDQRGRAQQEIPFVYRVHDLPDMERVAEFSRFAYEMGFPMKVDTPKQIAASYNRLMKESKKDERLKILEPLAIRTMAKAIYSTNNIGHYGLAFSHYSHFTSPIRRYSDVLTHRILERNLDGRTFRLDKTKLEEQCKHVSSQEKKAADAERESVKYKQVEWMKSRVGEVFDGVITGMIERGMFIQISRVKAEGMIAFNALPERYILDDNQLTARSRSGKDFRIGQKVSVRVLEVDMSSRQIELELMDE